MNINPDASIGGVRQQKITNCLEVLDYFLSQNCPVMASMVISEKSKLSANTPVSSVANILGIRDVKTVGPHSTLPEIGMDSIMAVEIKKILEDFDIVLTPNEIKNLTFQK